PARGQTTRRRARPRAGAGEHGGGSHRDGLPDKRRTGKAAHRGQFPEHVRAVNRGGDHEISRRDGRGEMTPRTKTIALTVAAAFIGTVVSVWVTVAVRRQLARPPVRAAVVEPPRSAPSGRKIKVRLFYVSTDGTKLTGIDREV